MPAAAVVQPNTAASGACGAAQARDSRIHEGEANAALLGRRPRHSGSFCGRSPRKTASVDHPRCATTSVTDGGGGGGDSSGRGGGCNTQRASTNTPSQPTAAGAHSGGSRQGEEQAERRVSGDRLATAQRRGGGHSYWPRGLSPSCSQPNRVHRAGDGQPAARTGSGSISGGSGIGSSGRRRHGSRQH